MNIVVTHGFEANYTLGFAKGLAANGVPLCVLSSDDTESRLSASGIQNVNIRGAQSEKRSGVIKILSLLGYYWRLVRFLYRHRLGTFHFTGTFRDKFIVFEGLILHPCIGAFSRRYIYTAHNVLPHNRENSFFFTLIYKIIYSVPDSIVVHTEQGRRLLVERFGVRADKVHVISIGLNEEIPFTSLSSSDARSALGYFGNEKLILFFGRIDEYKGLHLLIEAFETLDLSDSRLLIAGAVRSADYGRRIEGQIARSARRRDIKADLREIPNNEAEALFKAADVLCLPYLNIYQSGLVFLAARFGIPAVTTNVGSLAEFITPCSGLIAATKDAAGIKAALEEFFADPNRFDRERIRQAGAKYRWDGICRDLVPLYEPSGVA
jgi:D-inositol-3-phosphate glycosyltransferase